MADDAHSGPGEVAPGVDMLVLPRRRILSDPRPPADSTLPRTRRCGRRWTGPAKRARAMTISGRAGADARRAASRRHPHAIALRGRPRRHREHVPRRAAQDGRSKEHPDISVGQPEGWLRLSELRLAVTRREAAPIRVLRERGEGDGGRGHAPGDRGGLLRPAGPSTSSAAQSDHWLNAQGRLAEPMLRRRGLRALRAGGVGRGVRPDRPRAAMDSTAPTARRSTPRAARATRRRSCTSCSRGSSGPTTCPTAPTCVTSRRAPRWSRASASARARDTRGLRADRSHPDRGTEPRHQSPADAHLAGARQASRRDDHRDQSAGEVGFIRFTDPNPEEYPTPVHFAASCWGRERRWPTSICRCASTATLRCSRGS